MIEKRWVSLRAVLWAALALLLVVPEISTTAVAGPMGDATAAYDHGDYATASILYLPLATQGSAAAQYSLGFMYAMGQGVPQDFPAAMNWYRKAADQGDANAQNSLGYMIANGRGTPREPAEAVNWYR